MSVLTGEVIVSGQRVGGDVQIRIFGDEFYARYEALDGYTVVFDKDYGGYCYALSASGRFVSSGIPIGKPVPTSLRKHLKEDPAIRNDKFERNYNRLRPREVDPDSSATRTIGPDDGLLEGRKLHQGTVRGLTIIVDFDDVSTNISSQAVEDMFNAANYSAHGNYCSVNEYFKIVSSGKLNYLNTVVGPVKLSKSRSHYISKLLVQEALDIAVNQFNVNLADFDSRGEGIVDAINFLYAGESQYNGDLWPHNSIKQVRYGAVRTHYYQLTGLGAQEVDLRIGTICHENGHLLCRFPDMYDYGKRDGDLEKSQGIGRYCLMGSGNHLNARRTPSPVCGYLRELAGWVDNVVLLNSPDTITSSHGAYDTIWKHQTALPNEYFIVENRSQLGLDSHLPSSGLAVYHCDTLGSNEWQDGTRNRHYQCALLQADGSLDLENNRNAGDFSDLFKQTSGVAISDLTTPSSRAWDGTDSGLVISEIGVPARDITFTLGEPRDSPVVEAQSFPNLLIPDNTPSGATDSVHIGASGELVAISVTVDIIHSWISDLKVTLIAPDGTQTVLHDKEGDDGDDIKTTYNDVAGMAGTGVGGDWSLRVVDSASQDVGRLVSWGIVARYQQNLKTITETANPNLPIPDADAQGVSSQIPIQQGGNARRVAVTVDIEHTYIGDLRVELVSPSGQTVRLHDSAGGPANNIKRLYDVTSTPGLNDVQGESIQGDWQLKVRDLVAQDTGTLVSWTLTVDY